MTAIDRSEALERFGWRDEIMGQIVNTDIDGLLSAALLWELHEWPVLGFYDTATLWVTPEGLGTLRSRPQAVAWVDADMCWPQTRSISQHIILRDPREVSAVSAFSTTVNPNLCVTPMRTALNYRIKYPFGTFQWIWWLAGIDPPPVEDRIRTGLAWMPDGGFQSIGRFRGNCIEWATRILPGSPLDPLIKAGREHEARELVQEAEAWMISRCPQSVNHWHRCQHKMSRIVGNGSVVDVDPASPGGREEVDAILRAIAEAFGWDSPARSPVGLRRFTGTWCSGVSPAGWPASADACEIVSVAQVRERLWGFTLPGEQNDSAALRQALPACGS